MVGARIIAVVPGPCGGQLAFGIDLSQQDVGHRFAALLTGLGNLQNRFDMGGHIQQAGQFDGAAGVEQQDNGKAQVVQGAQFLPFLIAEVVVSLFQPAVLALA